METTEFSVIVLSNKVSQLFIYLSASFYLVKQIIIKITISSLVIGLKKVLFFTNSHAKLLSDSLLLDILLWDSSISQSHSKMQFKSTNHIQSCNYVCMRALAFVFLPVTFRMFTPPLSVFYCEFSPIFHNLAIFLFLGNCNFYD